MNRRKKNGLPVLLLMISLVLGAVAFADADSDTGMPGDPKSGQSSASAASAGEQIKWQVISAGGTDGESTNFRLNGTMGQTAAGPGTAAVYQLNHGFWQNFGAAAGCDPAGDANGDGTVDVGDAVFIINYVFKGGLAPNPLCCGDANGDLTVNVGDAVFIINYIFKGGEAPVANC